MGVWDVGCLVDDTAMTIIVVWALLIVIFLALWMLVMGRDGTD